MLALVRRVPADEAVVSAALLLFAVLAIGPRPVLVGFAWLAAVTPRLVAIDLAEHRLPDRIVLPGYPVVLLAVTADAAVAGADPLPPLLAGAATGVLLLLLHTAGGLGFGDVKLVPLLGALASVVVPGGAILLVVLAFAAGGVVAIGVLVRRGAGTRMAFGPALLLAAWAVLLIR